VQPGAVTIFQPNGDRKIAAARSKIERRSCFRQRFMYPLMFRLKQRFRCSTIADVSSAVEAELARLALGKRVQPGESVAVACGSRRIANHAVILKAVVDQRL